MRAEANRGQATLRYCGRDFSPAELDIIRRIADDPHQPTRAEIARAVCEALHWLQPDGRPKVMSCKVALQRMEAHGVIWLPLPTREKLHGRTGTGGSARGSLALAEDRAQRQYEAGQLGIEADGLWMLVPLGLRVWPKHFHRFPLGVNKDGQRATVGDIAAHLGAEVVEGIRVRAHFERGIGGKGKVTSAGIARERLPAVGTQPGGSRGQAGAVLQVEAGRCIEDHTQARLPIPNSKLKEDFPAAPPALAPGRCHHEFSLGAPLKLPARVAPR